MRARLYYDVVCPYSYMEAFAVEALEDRGELEVEWLPFELRPPPRPLLEPRGEHLRHDWPQNVYPRALARGIELHLPRFQPRSRLPLAACLWATELGALRPFKHALYDLFFCEGHDIAQDAWIAEAARRAGLDPDGALVAAYSPVWIGRLEEVRAEAAAVGVKGVPTLAAENGSTHWGMGGAERLLAGAPLVPRS